MFFFILKIENEVIIIMKLLTWNVNGLRSMFAKKNIIDDIHEDYNTYDNYICNTNADIICLTETKLTCKSIPKMLLDVYPYQYNTCSTTKLGYSGVSIYSKMKGKEFKMFDDPEGRMICLEFDTYIVIGVYVPNSGSKLERLTYRTQLWDPMFYNSIKQLKKPVIIMGDLNVINEDIDIFRVNKNSAGCTDFERVNIKNLLKLGLVDSYRYMNPNKREYTYYDYRSCARKRNAGWRLDYILVSESMKNNIKQSIIDQSVYGSDHIPVITVLE